MYGLLALSFYNDIHSLDCDHDNVDDGNVVD